MTLIDNAELLCNDNTKEKMKLQMFKIRFNKVAAEEIGKLNVELPAVEPIDNSSREEFEHNMNKLRSMPKEALSRLLKLNNIAYSGLNRDKLLERAIDALTFGAPPKHCACGAKMRGQRGLFQCAGLVNAFSNLGANKKPDIIFCKHRATSEKFLWG